VSLAPIARSGIDRAEVLAATTAERVRDRVSCAAPPSASAAIPQRASVLN
jgi:hypothetical protein